MPAQLEREVPGDLPRAYALSSFASGQTVSSSLFSCFWSALPGKREEWPPVGSQHNPGIFGSLPGILGACSLAKILRASEK